MRSISYVTLPPPSSSFFFFNDTATTEIYTLSLHDALPISRPSRRGKNQPVYGLRRKPRCKPDRKSTRLNSSHGYISYAVFCLKKKKKIKRPCGYAPLWRLTQISTRVYMWCVTSHELNVASL